MSPTPCDCQPVPGPRAAQRTHRHRGTGRYLAAPQARCDDGQGCCSAYAVVVGAFVCALSSRKPNPSITSRYECDIQELWPL